MKSTKLLLAACAAGSFALGAAEWSVGLINGVPRLMMDGKPQSNYIFSAARISKGNKLETDSVTSEIRMARKTGVKIYSISFEPFYNGPDDKAAIDFAENICKHVFENDPDAYLMPRVTVEKSVLAEKNMRLKNLSYDGSRDQPSLSAPEFREEARRALRDFIRYMEKHHGDRMMGYHPAFGNHGEFQYCNFARRGNYIGYDDATRTAFRKFLKEKYGTNEKLAAAWHKRTVTFENAMVPPPTIRFGSPDEAFHDPVKEQASIDFNEFLNNSMADFALELANVVREECGKKRIVGLFYGYSFECMPQGNGPSQSGHFALARVLHSPNVDMLCGPYSYSNQARVLGAPQFTHTVGESITAAGKLWVNEDDTATHISFARREWEDGSHRMTFDRDINETKQLIRRNFVFNMARNYGIWWYDHHSHGMWNDQELWNEKARADRIEKAIMKDPAPYTQEIVLSFDEKNAKYIVTSERPRHTLEGGISVLRDRVSRSGCVSGIWFLDDIVRGKAADAKLDIHGNAIALNKAERQALRARADKIPTIWMWAPGYIDVEKNEMSTKTIKELTGFTVRKVTPDTWCCVATPDGLHVNMPDTFGWGKTVNPVFSPVPEPGDVVLAYWRDLWGVPSIVFRPAKNGKPFSVFCGAVDLPSSVIRAYARKAGAHIYSSRNAGIHKGKDFTAITASEEGLYDLNVDGKEEWFDAYTGKSLGFGPQLKLNLDKGETVVACRKAFLDKIAAANK